MAPISEFHRLAALGYGDRLIPVIPPGAEVSPNSRMAGLIAAGKDARGKAPGVKGADGLWRGFRDWRHYPTIEEDLDRWTGYGANVGMRCGSGAGGWLCAFDADTMSRDWATIVYEELTKAVGRVPARVGRFPKALYLFRLSGPVPFMKMKFGLDGEPREHCEVLGAGKQFVAAGRHPSGKDYEWKSPLVEAASLPLVGVDVLERVFAALAVRLPNAGRLEAAGGAGGEDDGGSRSQDRLLAVGGVDEVRRVLAAIPNKGPRFETRESYLSVGYAVRAALGGGDEGLSVWSEWCAGWDGGDNDLRVVAADWARMKGPYRRGAGWLHELAEEVSGGAYRSAARWFESLDEDGDGPGPGSGSGLFPELDEDREARAAAAGRMAAVAGLRATPFDWSAAASVGPRAFLLGSHWIRKYVSATVAPSKVGKTALLVGDVLAAVSGKPLLGSSPLRQLRVWVWNGEDPLDEMQRRFTAAMRLHELTPEDIGDRLFLDSGRNMPIKIGRMEKSGAVIAKPVVDAVINTLLENKIDVLCIDPFISSHEVSENDNPAIDAVVKAWALIADRANCAVELIHHMRKLNGAEATVEDIRGGSSFIAATRSSRALARMTKEEASNRGLSDKRRRLFHIVDADSNVATVGDDDGVWFELASVNLPNGTDEYPSGDNVGAARLFDMEDAVIKAGEIHDPQEQEALNLIKSGEWRRDVRCGDAWVGKAIGKAFGVDSSSANGKTRLVAIIEKWISQGKIAEETRLDKQRRPRQFVIAPSNEDCF